tara:strand:- start:562 stop:939 length:378 start_codon:yes stop_codon:yes gene_type:complete
MEIKWYHIFIIYITLISLIVYLLKLFEKATKFMYKKYVSIKDEKKCLDHLRIIHIYSNPFIYSLMISLISILIIFSYLIVMKDKNIIPNILLIFAVITAVTYKILYCFIGRNITVDTRYLNDKII